MLVAAIVIGIPMGILIVPDFAFRHHTTMSLSPFKVGSVLVLIATFMTAICVIGIQTGRISTIISRMGVNSIPAEENIFLFRFILCVFGAFIGLLGGLILMTIYLAHTL